MIEFQKYVFLHKYVTYADIINYKYLSHDTRECAKVPKCSNTLELS